MTRTRMIIVREIWAAADSISTQSLFGWLIFPLTNTAYKSPCSKSCQPVLEATCRALPIVSSPIAWICMAPSLKASVMNVFRRTFAHAGPDQAASFIFVNNIWRLQKTRKTFRRGFESRLHSLQADSALSGRPMCASRLRARVCA